MLDKKILIELQDYVERLCFAICESPQYADRDFCESIQEYETISA